MNAGAPKTLAWEHGLFWAFVAWLCWLPLPIGSNRPLWVGLALAWLALIFIAWLTLWVRGAVHLPAAVLRARPVLWLMLIVLLWQALQLVLSGFWVPDFTQRAYATAGVANAVVSLDRTASFQALMESLLACGAFVAVLLLVHARALQYRLLWALVWVGVLIAVASSVTAMEGARWSLFGVDMSARGGVVSGTFVNRNHFANYLGLALSAGVGLLVSMQSADPVGGWRQRLRGWARTLLGSKARLRIFLALMVIALVLTRSRMGNTAFFLSLLVSGVVAIFLIRGRQRSLVLLLTSLVAIDILIIGTWFGVEQVVDRVQKSVSVNEQQEIVINDRARMEANREAWEIIQVVPWTGTGGGTWFAVFPAWRSFDHGFFDHAHNDYFEFAVEYGLPATVALCLFVALSGLRALLQLARRRDRLALGLAFGALMATVLVAVHALVEFNMHIPANRVTFLVLLALPWLHSSHGHHR